MSQKKGVQVIRWLGALSWLAASSLWLPFLQTCGWHCAANWQILSSAMVVAGAAPTAAFFFYHPLAL